MADHCTEADAAEIKDRLIADLEEKLAQVRSGEIVGAIFKWIMIDAFADNQPHDVLVPYGEDAAQKEIGGVKDYQPASAIDAVLEKIDRIVEDSKGSLRAARSKLGRKLT